jgi:SagB-type dehydrogenase family enzyme
VGTTFSCSVGWLPSKELRSKAPFAVTWREYHEFTKHSAEALRRTQHVLDWQNMPDPFRHYEGVPLLDLPADPPGPGSALAEDGPAFLSQLLFYSAAISASKLVPSAGYRYALRVNPSSGNLHPTEFHFLTRGLKEWPDGLYHYRPSSHTAEQRAIGDLKPRVSGSAAPIVFVLTSIAWREAWKYRDRAYRYCLHDIGHAWQALALAAEGMGCSSYAIGHFADDEVAQVCRLHEDEWPMLLIELRRDSTLLRNSRKTERGATGSWIGFGVRAAPFALLREPDRGETVWYGGHANELSRERIAYPRIDAIHDATKLIEATCRRGISAAEPAGSGSGEIKLPPPALSTRAFGEVARMRRSALHFYGGTRSISLPQLSAMLAAASAPLSADFAGARFIELYLYVHRVEGLAPGVYRFWPEHSELESIKPGDERVAAAGLSLGQELAGNACVAFSMIGDLERATRAHGDRGYRYVHFEAGAIGHRLYLAAEALGLGATGIGAFFDDEVHRYLNLTAEQGQVVYHFAIGYPVPDPRVNA